MELHILLQLTWVIIPSTSKYWDFILIYFKTQTSETRRSTYHMSINLFTNRFECIQTAICS